MSADWIEADFEGVYSGPLRSRVDARGLHRSGRQAPSTSEMRRFGFEIESGHARELRACDEPDRRSTETESLIRQARIKRVRLTESNGLDVAHETTLFDVHISDWQLKHPAEAGDRAYGTIVGTIRARRGPPIERGPTASPTPRLESDIPERQADTVDASDFRAKQPLGAKIQPVDSLVQVEATSSGWPLVWSVLWLAFAFVAYRWGPRNAVVWVAPIGAALGLLWMTQGGFVRGARWWLLGLLPTMQFFVLWSPLDLAWQSGCGPVLSVMQLLMLAAPIVLAAILGSRGAIWITSTIWTTVLFVGFAYPALDSCAIATGGDTSRSGETQVEDSERPRTDAQGRWPVMPAPRAGAAGSSSRVLDPAPEPDGTATNAANGMTGEAPPNEPYAPHPVVDAATQVESADRSGDAQMIDASPVTARAARDVEPSAAAEADRRLSEVDGGWLSPEHRRAPREHVLISVEQANRTPPLFFESQGAHRVYVPTDSIFEDASARLRPEAALVLARMAALMSLPSKQRFVLEVHSDSAGAPENQIELSRRRAQTVQSWLLDRGHIERSRFEMRPIGGARPLVPPDGDYSAQQPNRRIEIRLAQDSSA